MVGKRVDQMDFEELCDWAQLYIHQQFLLGNYLAAVRFVCSQASLWNAHQAGRLQYIHKPRKRRKPKPA